MSTAEVVDHRDLREAVRDFLTARSPSSAVRAAMDSAPGYDERVWRELTADLGLAAIAVPEEFGGAGAGPARTRGRLRRDGRSPAVRPVLLHRGARDPDAARQR
ncbi:acyl-CoA dehydrogenase family protein [Mycolicibacterium novocastrense]|nr:acyl-CoA dehydrogenase family protein [Mycolicibacterium novocastrense]